MFEIYNYKTHKTEKLKEKELKKRIISETDCKFENQKVKNERTGKRPSFLKKHIDKLKNGTVYEKLFLVTAVYRINSDKKTRYMLISLGKKDLYDSLISFVKNYIPVYHIDTSEYSSSHEGGFFSSWFRENMGTGFSLIDIDYLYLSNSKKILLIEEKTHIGKLGEGQKISYKELQNDVFDVKTIFLLIKINEKVEWMKIDGNEKKNGPRKTKNISLENLLKNINKKFK